MKLASLKINLSACLVGLSLLSLTPTIMQSANREATVAFKLEDREFIKSCISKITQVIEKADTQIREFLSEQNNEHCHAHIDRFERLIIEIEQDLIKPLNERKSTHESFQLAHESLQTLDNMLRRLVATLKAHESSTNYINLGKALEAMSADFSNFRTQLTNKVESLTSMVEPVAAKETGILKSSYAFATKQSVTVFR